MGCFDTIHFECPNCREKIKLQSKSGKCELKNYHYTSVPVEVASDVRNIKITCFCGAEYYIGMPTPRVKLILTPVNPPDEIIFD